MSKDVLPEHASVVVIGGGIMGCSTLYHLADMGARDAVLLERNALTSGTTWHSAAQVRALRHSRNLTRMIQYSIDLYGRLEAETGQAVGWIQKGSLSIATHADRLEHIRRQEALAEAFGVRARFVGPDEAAGIWPLMRSDDLVGAVFSPDDGRVSPSDVCAALVKGARAKGARLFEQTGVTGILTRNGRIHAVETARGVVRCDAVALCAGLWSREVAGWAGAAAPLLPCEHFYFLTRPVPGIEGNLPTLSDHDGHLYIRDDSGGLLVGCFEPRGKPIDPQRLGGDFAFRLLPEDWEHLEPMVANALHRLPVLAEAEIRTLLNGPESFTPDGTFMLGEAAETAGLFFGCGMNSVGLASGGGAGMNLAHCILNGRTAWDLGEADAKRFHPVFNRLEHLMARAPEVLGKHYEIAYPGRQWASARGLRAGPLDEIHAGNAAHCGQIDGFERPLFFAKRQEPTPGFGRPDWFAQVGVEVRAAHETAALFDASAFGKFEVAGPDAEAFLQFLCANDMSRPPGRVIYSALLNEAGGFESDLTAQRLEETHYRLFTGSTAVRRDLAWLRRHAEGRRVEITDRSADLAVIALMGPQAAIMAGALGGAALAGLGYFRVGMTELAGVPVTAARLSYVGEAGWELTCTAGDAPALYAALQEAGARPAGLYAQTAMRIEKGFRAMGHELDADVTPLEAGLEFAVAWGTGFLGEDALERRRSAAASRRRCLGLLFGDANAVPLGHEPIRVGNRIVGETTSAAFGYRLGRPVALGYVEAAIADDIEVTVDVARRETPARLSARPLFDPLGARMRPA